MIRCHAGCQWHEFPKNPLSNGARWSFDGNCECPTFSPSMNQGVNQPGPFYNPDAPSSRCHFIVTNGQIHYCGDCSHSFAGQTLPLLAWPDDKVTYYKHMKDAGWP